ncbi:hypothetical protein [Algoriphagus yeomjeoni]|uniref:Uncharacterized protein n=1 Tax=Algoriphagus yeomjeoni TaxID=291403 RepID=A0A327PBS5_9BACT|nr:hypothetical protein [Algoriphagus yeomjeoni]RAI88502.1 hypothetical protein LV83_02802 [Algoriphagus yeomjeoni]
MKVHLSLLLLFSFCSISTMVLGQKTSLDTTIKEPVTIKLICKSRDVPPVSMLIYCDGKTLFLPANQKSKDFFSKIDSNLIDTIRVKKDKEFLAKYDIEDEKAIILVYLNPTFMDSSSKKIRSKFN